MLRYLTTICDVISSICALVSPVAIFHWLFKMVDLAPLRGFVSSLDGLFMPLNAVLELFIKLPHLHYGGHSYATTQGLLALMLAGVFFLFGFFSETLKVGEQRLKLQVDVGIQRRRLQKIREEQQQMEKKLPQDLKIFVFLDYDTKACPAMGASIETLIAQERGHIHSRMFNELALEFKKVEDGLRFCFAVSHAISSYYDTLRPFDPQPPFRISLHGSDKLLTTSAAVSEVRKLINFVLSNQIIISETTKSLLVASGTPIPYRLQSLGMYSMDSGSARELFRVFAGNQSTKF
jgi:hypothetical protein